MSKVVFSHHQAFEGKNGALAVTTAYDILRKEREEHPEYHKFDSKVRVVWELDRWYLTIKVIDPDNTERNLRIGIVVFCIIALLWVIFG